MSIKSGTLTGKSDGTTGVVVKNFMVVYGGVVKGKVWLLNLDSFTWEERICTNAPETRLYHSACSYGSNMLVYGGELLSESEDCPYYELDCSTFEWRQVPTSGSSPGSRSHHSASIVNNKMYLLGGKRTISGRPNPNQTAADLARDKSSGFFDIFILDITSRSWTSIRQIDALHPSIWGHTAVVFRHFLLFFGGFDVSEQDDSLQPTAVLSDVVHTFNLQSLSWTRSTPTPPCPIPRAIHNALLAGTQMVIFGGVTVSDSTTKVVNDAWSWDIATGVWTTLPFCLQSWSSKRLLSVVYQNNIIVTSGIGSCHKLNISNKQQGWQEQPCDATSLCGSGQTSNKAAAVEKRPPEQQRPPDEEPTIEVSDLHQQLHQLQGQLQALRKPKEQAGPIEQWNTRNNVPQRRTQQQGHGSQQVSGSVSNPSAEVVQLQDQLRSMQQLYYQQQQQQLQQQQHQHHQHQQQHQPYQPPQRMDPNTVTINKLQEQLASLQVQQRAQQEAIVQQQMRAASASGGYPFQPQFADSQPQLRTTTPSGRDKLEAYRRNKRRGSSRGASASQETYASYQSGQVPQILSMGGGNGGQVDPAPDHDVRRRRYLSDLQDRLKEIENDVEQNVENQLRQASPPQEPSLAPTPVVPLQFQPQQVLAPATYVAPPPQQQQQQQPAPFLPPQQPTHPVEHNKRISPVKPNQPADWQMLRDILGDEYAQINTGRLQFGRLLSPSGSPGAADKA